MKKKISTVFLMLMASVSFGQNYKLFNAGSKKLFTEYPVPQNGFSISFDTAMQSGADSVYYNFLLTGNVYINSDSCMFWGGPQCNKINIPSWIGKKIIYDNQSKYRFFNIWFDSLSFNFTTNPSDTLVFFEDPTQKFLYAYYKSDTLTVLNNIDSARFYKIIHTDPGGNVINSALNQQDLVISKNWGLVRFFKVDSFPQQLKPFTLIGSKYPAGGLYQLTNEIVYDYHPGDVYQYYDYYHPYNGSWFHYDYYKKYTILTRTLTPDSIIYGTNYEYFETDTNIIHSSTINLKYKRNTIIGEIPFERFNGIYHQLKYLDYCGLKAWTYFIHDYIAYQYCAQDTCWGTYDSQGPPPDINYQYPTGLGLYYYWNMIPPTSGYILSSGLIYFKKDGKYCGDEIVLGVNESIAGQWGHISPNPATTTLTISGLSAPATAEIYDISGKLLLSLKPQTPTIDISLLATGLYFIKLTTKEGSVVRKFVKE